MKAAISVSVIRVDGATEQHTVRSWAEIYKLLGRDVFDLVNLRDGNVMLVDDTGMIDGKPVNPEATKLYHGVCKPGTVHCIHGDVAIVRDADFA